MDKLIKLFPFMPAEKDGGKLALAIVFYIFVPPIACAILGFITAITLILPFIIGLASSAYTIMGIVFAVMSYTGQPLPGTEAAVPTEAEATAEEQE